MPSPFPGMDPYLEDPVIWPGLHARIINIATDQLQPQLRSRGYFADIGERIWLSEPERSVYPDIAAIESPRPPTKRVGAAALLEHDEPVLVHRYAAEIRETFVEIFDAAGNRLVTAIEVLSPTNKTAGEGLELYLRKQRELSDAGVHLVEIDLLRGGSHTVTVPREAARKLKPWDYLVNVRRAHGDDYEVYPITLRQRLPRIRIPLKADDADAVLDLQAVLDLAYDSGPYPERLRYADEPIPPLTKEDAEWAKGKLEKNVTP